MDEEQEILQSSLEQSDKISIGSFFGSPIGGLANRAILQSNTSLKSSISNRNLIATLQASIELLRGQLQKITTYVLLDRQERGRIVKQKEKEAFEREDQIQKGIIRPENAQPRGLEDSLPFFPEARFSEGLTAGMSSIGERQGVAQFQERFVEGSKSFRFGGFVTGNGNADTINAKLTPGEFVVPKNVVENFSPSFFKGLISSGKKDENVNSNDNFTDDSFNLNTSISYSTRGNPKTGEIEVDPNSLEYPFMLEAATQQFYQDEIEKLESEIFDQKLEARVFGKEANVSELEKKLNKYKGKYDDTLEYGTRYNVGGDKRDDSDDKKGGFFKNLFGSKKNENVKSDDKKGGFFKNLFGSKKNENVKNDDKKGRDLFGIMGGTIDALTGNLTDLDKKGGKPFGLMRGITGITDAMTGNLFDFDRRGKGKENNEKMEKFIAETDADFDDFDDKQLQNKKNQLSMETIVNPDGSITSKGSGTFIGDELFTPGQPLTKNQKMRIQLGLSMGNTYSEEIMKSYNMEDIKSEDVRPEEEKSKNLKSEQTLGEKFMNVIKGDKKEESGQLLSRHSNAFTAGLVESVNENNLKVDPSESIKTAAQGLMTPPPPPQSETIELPPQNQGDAGGGAGIPAGAPPFKPSTPNHDPLTGTESPLIFVEVISNPFLSIP